MQAESLSHKAHVIRFIYLVFSSHVNFTNNNLEIAKNTSAPSLGKVDFKEIIDRCWNTMLNHIVTQDGAGRAPVQFLLSPLVWCDFHVSSEALRLGI